MGSHTEVVGPPLIVEPAGTNMIEAGRTAGVDTFGDLVLARTSPRVEARPAGTQADPVMLEVMGNLYMSIAEQMGATLADTAYSVNIKEQLDFSCAIFKAAGNLVAMRRTSRCNWAR